MVEAIFIIELLTMPKKNLANALMEIFSLLQASFYSP
jgi:hypothetical protein